jgi:serine/threonine protein kinase
MAHMMNSFVGTLIYSCPEIVQNRPYTEKADIWSLGCILYELITLKPPFQSSNPLTLAKKIVDLEYEKIELAALSLQYSPELIAFVEQCLVYDEAKRLSILQLLALITPHVVEQMDAAREKEQILNEEIIGLTRKMNQKKNNNDLNVFFGDELLGENNNKMPVVKIDVEKLNRIDEDPVTKFVVIMQKISVIANAQTN